ncbi:hypothetical protein CCR97_23335 [Rhodoplanes elegans]|uniref:Uncharacterized protein n=1 Tax=Rhodoplanes elegans TaxID=29408 RepID=A0A327KKQ2_9BRAD|nr:hypothetical protein [Rhodoplanes elegans]MBK5961115.1 hypothetical protein [Rhodoplanes elegans]RAI39057.1 hypothetical protein CH338_10635 [Rhodoplanes elegans]
MTETGQKFLLFVLIGLLALPSGLCSALFTVSGLGMLFDRDPVAQVASGIMLVGSAIGWIFCALVLIGARRVRGRPVTPAAGDPAGPPSGSAPP